MPTLRPLEPETATGKTKELLDLVLARTGRIPNMIRMMSNSAAALGAYLNFATAFRDGVLPERMRDLIGISVAEASSADYALSAACALAKSGGASAAEIEAARNTESNDPRTSAALAFAAELVARAGHLPSGSVDALRASGFNDGEISEIVATVLLNLYRSWFNLVAGTEIDFPVVKSGR